MVIQTPRVGLIADSLMEAWEHFLPFEHVVLYSRESLVELFVKAGYELKKAGSFGANAFEKIIPQPYKNIYDRLAKISDNGATQMAYFVLKSPVGA